MNDRAPSRPCTVGLTGGLASGKSAVAARLERLGAAVLDADRIVHGLYQPGKEGAAVVAELFGAELLDGEGRVDREALGERVLGDAAALERLGRAVHPLVRRHIRAWLDEVRRPVAVVEAALLVETGAAADYDLLVVVWCRPEQQLERALARGVDEARAAAVLRAQLPIDDKRRCAGVVIDNSGTVEQLEHEVARAWREIKSRCRRPCG